MIKKIAFPLIACLALASSAFAGHEMKESKEYKSIPVEPCFKDQEFQLDVFGSYNNALVDNYHGDGFGGGIAVNYFFIRYLGVGVDGNVYDGQNGAGNPDAVWSTTGRIIARYPIESLCLAPYVFVGGGIEGNGSSFATLHTGGGLEWRVVKEKIGVFGEGRYTWGENERNSAQVRAGVRFVF